MIVSKPKSNTLFSLGVFILLAFIALGFNVVSMIQAETPAWWHILLIVLLAPIGFGLLLKVLLGYQIVTMGKNRMSLRRPFRGQHFDLPMSQLDSWNEEIIKTGSGVFKQATLIFQGKQKISLSYQEHTNYPAVMNYLRKKHPKKQHSK